MTIRSVEHSIHHPIMHLTTFYKDESKTRVLRGRLSYFHGAATLKERCHTFFLWKVGLDLSTWGLLSF